MVISTDYEKICDDFIAIATEFGVRKLTIDTLVYEYMHKANSIDIEILTEQLENEKAWSRERSLWE